MKTKRTLWCAFLSFALLMQGVGAAYAHCDGSAQAPPAVATSATDDTAASGAHDHGHHADADQRSADVNGTTDCDCDGDCEGACATHCVVQAAAIAPTALLVSGTVCYAARVERAAHPNVIPPDLRPPTLL